jgi:2-polyprenyl-3-methyl-5-hydroxy-6-metoxy-1,4-benzoquinol methylase
MQEPRSQHRFGAEGRDASVIQAQSALRSAPEVPSIDWRWKDASVVPAYYERALAPMRGLPPVGARMLEVGVGCGYVLSKLTLSCRGRGVGVDNDRHAIELSGRVAASFGVRITRVRGEGQRLPFADGSFDVVYSQGLIEHFPPYSSERLVAEHGEC